ncbi:hypothetical protein [Dyadobacter sp. LHD-138]|uniref:hypothetical protein n=1 Tax=Dyadobacter sp. LHD-138 TaxID=3071413 RepID=UPI0027E04EFA|nr:hypothetical protein [Dyadobacter sp. LHD-138]MDQ6481836.1 hypothetical protein [Dyadobacter sp. LHD-138]
MKHGYLSKKIVLGVISLLSGSYFHAHAQNDAKTEPWKSATKEEVQPGNARMSGVSATNGTITYDGTGAGTSGDSSSYFGFNAGRISTGDRNVFIGNQSGYSNTTGKWNVYMGSRSGFNATTGYFNVFVGYQSGRDNSIGQFNAFLGSNTGMLNTTGKFNTIMGSQAGVLNSTGENNTLVGNGAGYSNSTGWYNTMIGESCGVRITNGTGNTFLGSSSGRMNETGSRNVLIGYRAGFNEMGSDKLYIANSDTISPLIKGDFSLKQLVFNGQVGVGTNSYPTSLGGESLSNYKLFVKGGVLAEEIRIRNDWADYVFDDSYELKSLPDVKSFIIQNRHLPNIPSAVEIKNSGLNLGEIAKVQMEKIEELTLYLIKQDEVIKQLTERLSALEIAAKVSGEKRK